MKTISASMIDDDYNIIDEAVNRAAKEMAEEIDFQMLLGLYKEMGWTEITCNPHRPNWEIALMKEWTSANCKGYCMSRGNRFLFEYEKDAMWFSMRWV